MAKESTALKELKAASRKEPGPEYADRLDAELEGQSDRAAVILVSTVIEDALERRIRLEMRTMTDKEADDLFGFEKPLGTFSARISIGWAMSIYGGRTKRDLNHIRALRNACAHSRFPLTFAEELAPVARLLSLPEFISDLSEHDKSDPKRRFVATCHAYSLAFQAGHNLKLEHAQVLLA